MQASKAACNGVSSMFVRFIETCAIPYSSTYQPMAFTCFNIPGMRTGSPFSSSTFLPVGLPSSVLTRPFSRTSNATELARRTDFGVQVHIVGDEEIARADHGRAGAFIEHRRSEIRLPSGLFDLLKESFVFAGANDGEVRPRRICAPLFRKDKRGFSTRRRRVCLSDFAQAIASSQLTLLTGMNGQTSVAPIRGCAPFCFRMSISSAAF